MLKNEVQTMELALKHLQTKNLDLQAALIQAEAERDSLLLSQVSEDELSTDKVHIHPIISKYLQLTQELTSKATSPSPTRKNFLYKLFLYKTKYFSSNN